MKYYKGQGYWSVMECCGKGKINESHPPHVWNGKFCFYGPYLCNKYPEPIEYVGRHRKDDGEG